jgi:lysozyme family protein
MSNFDLAFIKTIGHEGGYTSDPDDRGNWTSGKRGVGELKGTKYGISAMTYPNEDIINLTLERAKEIYKRDFWDKMKLSFIGDSNIAIELFDTAVNTGIPRAGKMFQKALNLCNRNERDYKNIKEDGVIGQKSLTAYSMCANKRILFNVLNILQGAWYVALMESNEMYEKYISWFDRVEIIKK